MMNRAQWNRKRIVILISIIFLFYLLLSAKYYSYLVEGIAKNTKPENVWEFVADFSKMKILNPTILDFTITADSGSYEHWKYSVLYKEKLSHWPYWENLSSADFSVRKRSSDEGGQFVIESQHRTCFLAGLYCLKSQGEFKFTSIGKDTYCIESVYYECPTLFTNFCRQEVEYQRNTIMRNLISHFNKKAKN